MDPWIQALVVSFSTVIASSGFWGYLHRKDSAKSATTRLLMGVAYEKIVRLGMMYIDRGWVSNDEYEDFRKFLYEPYSELGGNGAAQRIMQDVMALPLRSRIAYYQPVEARMKEE